MDDERRAASDPAGVGNNAMAETRRWLDRWRTVGPLLDEERWGRLAASSEEALRQQSWDLLGLWQPGVVGDDGEGLILLQRCFASLRERDRA